MIDTPAPDSPATAAQRPGIMKSLYLWVLHWAETPYGTPALFGLSFAESSFFPIPPDVLQIALSISKPRRSFYYALISGVGSVAGAVLGWIIGYFFWAALGQFFFDYFGALGFTPENFETARGAYEEWGFLAIFVAAFSPIPFKVFTISAGVCNVSLVTLIVASFLGRFARFFAVAVCIYVFGPNIKAVLDKYFGLATLIFFVLLVGGFAMIKYLL